MTSDIRQAVKQERHRCARLLEQAIEKFHEVNDGDVARFFAQRIADIKRGKNPVDNTKRKRAPYVCGYCDGDGHTRKKCQQRLAEEGRRAAS